MRAPRERYYSSYTDDFVTTRDQDLRLPEDYEWIRRDARSRVLSALSYGTALLLSSFGCRLFLHVRFKRHLKKRPTVRSYTATILSRSAMCSSRRSHRFRAAYTP